MRRGAKPKHVPSSCGVCLYRSQRKCFQCMKIWKRSIEWVNNRMRIIALGLFSGCVARYLDEILFGLLLAVVKLLSITEWKCIDIHHRLLWLNMPVTSMCKIPQFFFMQCIKCKITYYLCYFIVYSTIMSVVDLFQKTSIC